MSDKTEDQIEDEIINWSGLGAQEVVKDCINLFKSGRSHPKTPKKRRLWHW